MTFPSARPMINPRPFTYNWHPNITHFIYNWHPNITHQNCHLKCLTISHEWGKPNPKMGLWPNAREAWKEVSTISRFGLISRLKWTLNSETSLFLFFFETFFFFEKKVLRKKGVLRFEFPTLWLLCSSLLSSGLQISTLAIFQQPPDLNLSSLTFLLNLGDLNHNTAPLWI